MGSRNTCRSQFYNADTTEYIAFGKYRHSEEVSNTTSHTQASPFSSSFSSSSSVVRVMIFTTVTDSESGNWATDVVSDRVETI